MTAKLMASWNYLPHQVEWSDRLYEIISRHGFAILASEERTGKTGTFIRLAEESKSEKILILTKKAAISGIEEHVVKLGAKKRYTITNYQAIHKLTDKEFDLVILDEFHQALCSYPKPSGTYTAVKKITAGLPILYVSATPFSESYSQAYHSLKLSDHSPFKHKTFYTFHKDFGIECLIYMSGRQIKQYHLTQENRIKSLLSKYIVKATRKDVGFEHEPEDIVHIVELSTNTKSDINMYKKTKMKHFGSDPVPLESTMAEANAIYLRGGGFVENDGDCYQLSSEKFDYFMEHFGDRDNVAIMAHYKCEQKYLTSRLKNATVLSSTSHAEGVDLHKYDYLVIYSMSFSTSKHVQRRARQCNINRKDEIKVHFLLTDHGLDKHIYDTVNNKKTNFTARIYSDE